MKKQNPVLDSFYNYIDTICADFSDKFILNNPAPVDQYAEIAADEAYKGRDMTILTDRKCPWCGDERMIRGQYWHVECILCDAIFSEYDCMPTFEQKKIDDNHIDDWAQFGNY